MEYSYARDDMITCGWDREDHSCDWYGEDYVREWDGGGRSCECDGNDLSHLMVTMVNAALLNVMSMMKIDEIMMLNLVNEVVLIMLT